ncbi:MAG: DUF2845 domain-containing protein [Gammaproteobacteria bacterium]
MRFHYLAFLLCLPSTISFAFFCPSNFNQISAGSTMEEVIATCGKPDTQETKEVKAEPAQSWSYFLPSKPQLIYGTPNPSNVKTEITFDTAGKAVNIIVNNMATASTTVCGRTVNIGDTRAVVESACGKPSFINKQDQDAAPGELSNALGKPVPPMQVTTFTYNSNPPVTLTFENGKLKEK